MNLLKLFRTGTKISDVAGRVARLEDMLMFCGDGSLKDGSKCSREFRAVLRTIGGAKLTGFLQSSFDQENDQRARVLFDVAHELGRRLGFQVTYGSYDGRGSSIGAWRVDDLRLDVNLVFPASASRGVAGVGSPESAPNKVLVVVLQDEPALAAQIRGSRYGWNTRLVSCQALARLAEKTEGESAGFVRVARGFLAPVEYTQVDSLLDLFGQLSGSVGSKTKRAVKAPSVKASVESAKESRKAPVRKARKRSDLVAKRLPLINGLAASKGLKFEKKRRSGSSYGSTDGSVRACLGVSRHYGRSKPYYMFSLTRTQVDYMSGVPNGYYVMGCLDKDVAYAVPVDLIRKHLDDHTKSVTNGLVTWQIKVIERDGRVIWNIARTGVTYDLQEYGYPLVHSQSSGGEAPAGSSNEEPPVL